MGNLSPLDICSSELKQMERAQGTLGSVGQGNYNWTRARSGSFEHPNFGYRMREALAREATQLATC